MSEYIHPDSSLPPAHIMQGEWPGGAHWELVVADTIPPDIPITTAAGVALRFFTPYVPELVMQYSVKRGGWEIPGGHRDPVDPSDPNSPLETPEAAFRREAMEETGFHTRGQPIPYAHRRVTNPPGSDYPEQAITLFYWATTDRPLQQPAAPDGPPIVGTFQLETLRELTRNGQMAPAELTVATIGLMAARRHLKLEPS